MSNVIAKSDKEALKQFQKEGIGNSTCQEYDWKRRGFNRDYSIQKINIA